METLGERLKYIRKSHNLTQTELANKLHLTKNQISTYENNTVPPSIDVLISYCRFFKISADSILNINNNASEIEYIDQLILQIENSTKRMTSEQRKQYLKQLRLYAIFLERYRESL
ncbi:helix-turn-helix domain-containing protein [Heyndrickxia sporothermodurans]|uniref:helix-turn-helix domain-containing protein n=1 Tax=Heyndrickxia sporothermodurans TaxID=46224 RepID=UPI0009FF467E